MPDGQHVQPVLVGLERQLPAGHGDLGVHVCGGDGELGRVKHQHDIDGPALAVAQQPIAPHPARV